MSRRCDNYQFNPTLGDVGRSALGAMREARENARTRAREWLDARRALAMLRTANVLVADGLETSDRECRGQSVEADAWLEHGSVLSA